jgi:cardiolipin synthase
MPPHGSDTPRIFMLAFSFISSSCVSAETQCANGLHTVWLAVIILGRDVGLAISAIYYRWISLPPPKTFTRYWDFSLPSAEVHPTTISKYNTALQLGLIGATTALPLVSADVSVVMTGMQ